MVRRQAPPEIIPAADLLDAIGKGPVYIAGKITEWLRPIMDPPLVESPPRIQLVGRGSREGQVVASLEQQPGVIDCTAISATGTTAVALEVAHRFTNGKFGYCELDGRSVKGWFDPPNSPNLDERDPSNSSNLKDFALLVLDDVSLDGVSDHDLIRHSRSVPDRYPLHL